MISAMSGSVAPHAAVSGSAQAPAPRVRVVTLNVWNRHGEWPDRRGAIIEGLRGLQPDLVAFQESISTDGYDQVVDLLGAGYAVVHHTEREPDGSGISIASRWPLGEVEEVDLHVTDRTTDFWCSALIAEVRTPAEIGPLLFVNHCPSFKLHLEHERGLQAVVTARRIEELVGPGEDVHVVVAGDQDARPDSDGIRFWTGRQALGGTSVCYVDAWEDRHPGQPGHTFTPENPLVANGHWRLERGRRIDYVFVRCGRHGATLAVTACERIFDRPIGGVWASDHFGVMADLAVAPRPHLDRSDGAPA
jgi:endonuclease/exonuclease/phosphatase family metal-dependent hydrolase